MLLPSIAQTLSLGLNGILAGFSMSMNCVGVPTIKASRDPLPAFTKLYENGSRIAVSLVLLSTGANLFSYCETGETHYALAAISSFALIPWTLMMVAPVNNALFALQKQTPVDYDRQQVLTLVTKWNSLQYARTLFALVAFLCHLW